ncbi:MAG: Maf-like protein [Planctomycetes bacterium]|nr:Maf-like protein [Planctomycetota bacterium]
MTAPLVLASGSARRRELLEAAGFPTTVLVPRIDDGRLRVRADHAGEDCSALAWFKIAQILRQRERLSSEAPHARVVLAADTVCVLDDRVLGKPSDASMARQMIESAVGRTQRVVTGVAIHCMVSGRRFMSSDTARVRFGEVPHELIEAYIGSGAWQGRAGGYHIEEILLAGWPVECEGDPSTISGLPLRMVLPILRRLLGASGALHA